MGWISCWLNRWDAASPLRIVVECAFTDGSVVGFSDGALVGLNLEVFSSDINWFLISSK